MLVMLTFSKLMEAVSADQVIRGGRVSCYILLLDDDDFLSHFPVNKDWTTKRYPKNKNIYIWDLSEKHRCLLGSCTHQKSWPWHPSFSCAHPFCSTWSFQATAVPISSLGLVFSLAPSPRPVGEAVPNLTAMWDASGTYELLVVHNGIMALSILSSSSDRCHWYKMRVFQMDTYVILSLQMLQMGTVTVFALWLPVRGLSQWLLWPIIIEET